MNFRSAVLACAVSGAAALFATMPAADAATYVYVGNWQVDSGPSWLSSPPNGPLAYTGQEAAALLFGGSPSSYVISTVDNNPANINFDAWYSVIGFNGNQGNGGSILPDNYSDKYLGLYYGPTSGYPFGDPSAPASAYVSDNAEGAAFQNFAFLIEGAGAVPEPATWALLILGFGGIGFALRRQRSRETLAIAGTR